MPDTSRTGAAFQGGRREMNQSIQAAGISRRRILQTGLGVAGGLALARPGFAAEQYPSIGTFPAGVGGATRPSSASLLR